MSPRHLIAAALVAALVPAASGAQTAKPVAPGISDAQVEGVVRKWVDEHPELIIESLNRYVAKENAKKAEGRNQQALGALPEIFDAANQPTIGNPSGKVTLTYFLDGACGYCKAMTPAMDELAAANPDVRIVHRWVAFLGPASEYTLRAVTVTWKRHPDRYPALYHDLMTQKGQLSNETVDKALSRALGDDVALQVRSEVMGGADRKSVDEAVAANMGLARNAAVDGTPTVFVSGLGAEGIMRGLQNPEALKAAVQRSRTASARP